MRIVRFKEGPIDFSTVRQLSKTVRKNLFKFKGVNELFTRNTNLTVGLVKEHLAAVEYRLATTQNALDKANSDLAEVRRQAQRYRFQSLHDSLTSLPNRLSIQECLDNFIHDYAETDNKLAVLFIDIDKFKLVNDMHGHAVGDKVIQIVSARISHAIRGDDRVGRLGGDEFLCLIANAINNENTAQVTQKLVEAVRRPIHIGETKLTIEASIGVAIYPDNGVDSQSLIKRADAAMYVAKRSGAKFAFYDSANEKL
jgi:diguanylate cyclase (GGDEF)-like protein